MNRINSSSIISNLITNKIFKENDGNPNAALTRFRDHGLINNNNFIGDDSIDYLSGNITLNELIIDLFFKRPCCKKNSPNLKPLVLLCCVFDLMFEVAPSYDSIYLTYSECYKYFYNCNSIDDISIELIDTIINNRKYIDERGVPEAVAMMKQNEITNLSIWFNALKNTTLFLPCEDRTMIRPNVYQREFFKFIATNGYKISCTPTDNNTVLYDYYCSRYTGLSEIIPFYFKPNVMIRDIEEVPIIVNYLFGINKKADFDFSYYFDRECFGVYYCFISMSGLVARVISKNNKPLGELISSCLKNGLYK